MSEGKKMPSHEVYFVRDNGRGMRASWLRLGAAWTNDNGSISVRMDTMPIGNFTGDLVLLPPRKKDEQPAQGGQGGQETEEQPY